jgi:hypothetical protein
MQANTYDFIVVSSGLVRWRGGQPTIISRHTSVPGMMIGE